MGQKRKTMEDEMSRFEQEIAKPATTNMFVPRTVIRSNTFAQVQQRMQSIPPPPIPPNLPPFLPPPMLNERQQNHTPSEPTPVIVCSAPKLYSSRPTVSKEPQPAQPSMVWIASKFIPIILLTLFLTDGHSFGSI
jgi:hypothetical protein